MRWDTAAAVYYEILITRSVAMVTITSIAAISGSYFLGHVVSTYQIWVCYVMEWPRYMKPPSNGIQYFTRLCMLRITTFHRCTNNAAQFNPSLTLC